MVEQTQRELHPKYAPDRVIYHGLGHNSGLHEVREMWAVGVALHVHIYARGESLGRGNRMVGSHALRNQLSDGVPVADHEALEAPFFAEDLSKSHSIGAGGNFIERLERTHEG